jgi:hypothetical protein
MKNIKKEEKIAVVVAIYFHGNKERVIDLLHIEVYY